MHGSSLRALVHMRKRRQLLVEMWTAEVSEWLVENGLPEYVARIFEGTVFHHCFHFVPIGGLYIKNKFCAESHN